jgi:VIT1/CCC1 family predicted Fe2+/Mn2+ transporter
LFYQLKGFSADEAKALASRIAAQPDQALKMLAHEELGLSETTFPNPWRAAISATLSTAAGAFIPVIPFFFAEGWGPVIASFVISTLAHFCIGAAKTIVTGRSLWKSGAEMTLVGVGEAAVTYVLGLAFGKVIA